MFTLKPKCFSFTFCIFFFKLVFCKKICRLDLSFSTRFTSIGRFSMGNMFSLMWRCHQKKKKEIFSPLYNLNYWAYKDWCVLLRFYIDGFFCFKYYFFIKTLVDIYILSSYFYGPQRISFILDFLSKSQ